MIFHSLFADCHFHNFPLEKHKDKYIHYFFFSNFFSNVNFSSEFKSFLFTIIFFPLVPFTLQFVYKQRLALKSIQFVENELKFDLEYPIYDQIIELRKSWPYEEMCNFCFRKIIVFSIFF